MDKERLLATIVAPLESYAKLLATGEIEADQAGAVLELLLAGVRAEIEGCHFS